VTVNGSDGFDPRRIGWWQRQGAVRRIKKAVNLTDADRDLRVQSAKAAQTRGEIIVLMQGLVDPGPAGQLLPRGQYPSLSVPRSPQQPAPQAAPGTQPSARKKSMSGRLLIGLVVVVLLCGGSLVSCVSALVDSVRDISSGASSTAAPDIDTEEGWTQMVEAFAAETDLEKTVGLLARRRFATLSVETGDTAAARYYYDGDVTTTSGERREPTNVPFDLAEVDASVVVQTIARARRSSGVSDLTQAWVQVWAVAGGPRILVTFPDSSDTYGLVVDADGAVLNEAL
jgi:hypothetical protein